MDLKPTNGGSREPVKIKQRKFPAPVHPKKDGNETGLKTTIVFSEFAVISLNKWPTTMSSCKLIGWRGGGEPTRAHWLDIQLPHQWVHSASWCWDSRPCENTMECHWRKFWRSCISGWCNIHQRPHILRVLEIEICPDPKVGHFHQK